MASRLTRVVLLLAVSPQLGCQTTPAPRLVSCPLPTTEQTAEILDIAPLGTSRDEAIKRLKEAGIVGNFSKDSNSTYYCDIWQREGTERWHINVVLLFDEDGTLYGTLPQLPSAAKGPRPTQTDRPIADTGAQLVPLQ